MEFLEFNRMLQQNFKTLTADSSHLFELDVDKEDLWNLYLDSFHVGTNKVFRKRREFDCSCCRQFVKSICNVAVIVNNEVKTIWDFETNDAIYQPVLNALSTYLKSRDVSGVYVSKLKKIGVKSSFEQLQSGRIIEWSHFFIELPDRFVDKSSKSEGELKGFYKDTKNVFKRSLDEISEDSLLTVLELISQNSLYKGEEWRAILIEFLKYEKEYAKLQNDEDKDNYACEQSVKAGVSSGRIKNHSIGTLLVNISEGMDLNLAVKKYESIIAPHNYKRPKAIFTNRMLEEAKRTIEELGYLESLNRRYATLDDITVNNILFSNRDSSKRIIGADIFSEMSKEIPVNPKKFSKVEEIPIEMFITNILPSTNKLEVFLENKHSKNMVSLIAPNNKNSNLMFKWDNPFSWAYSGNITDSSMRDMVKSAGGNIDGVLRFSIQWNDVNDDKNDLDAHCVEPDGDRISWRYRFHKNTTGQLDVDIMNPTKNQPAVENITWSNKEKMPHGVYTFSVHNFSHRGGRNGFRAEIEFEGQIFSFEYNKELKHNEYVQVAEVLFDKDSGFTIKEKLPFNMYSKEVWNLNTNQFIPVSVVMLSPNYWNEQHAVGNKHYFFMLNGCVNTENPNGFYNEFLKQDLVKHKRVFEALGGRMAVKDVDDQLSGIGFSSTKRDELLVKVRGQSERVLKIKF
ncbi:MAG: hypothetical protein RR363_04070 [Rikenellaceae bacterium]